MQSLIVRPVLTFEGGLNLRMIEADYFVTVRLYQPER